MTSSLHELRSAVEHHNTWLQYSKDLPVSLETNGARVTLRTSLAEETFTLDGLHLRGRGGQFDLSDASQCAQALMTVQQTGLHDQEHALGLSAAAQTHGMRLYTGRMLRWKYSFVMTPVHLKAPDGRVLWLAEYQDDNLDGAASISIHAGGCRLAGYHRPLDGEMLSLMGLSDEEMQESFGEVLPVPEQVTASAFHLRPEALTALLTGQTPPASGLLPEDFFSHPERYERPELTVTRAQIRERRQTRQTARTRPEVC